MSRLHPRAPRLNVVPDGGARIPARMGVYFSRRNGTRRGPPTATLNIGARGGGNLTNRWMGVFISRTGIAWRRSQSQLTTTTTTTSTKHDQAHKPPHGTRSFSYGTHRPLLPCGLWPPSSLAHPRDRPHTTPAIGRTSTTTLPPPPPPRQVHPWNAAT